MERVAQEELLNEDGWKMVKRDGIHQLWRKDRFFVWFNTIESIFSKISVDEPSEKPP